MKIIEGDALTVLEGMEAGSVHCCITSPPYFGLRDYGDEGQIGLEPTPDAYVQRLVAVFREVKRVLRDDGTLWLNLGDSYASAPPGNTVPRGERARSDKFNDMGRLADADRMTRKKSTIVGEGVKQKDLLGIPWMVAFALRADGWYLRSEIIWAKKNCMPESVTDRPTKSHEQVFLFSKSQRYYFDQDAVREGVQSMWDGPTADGVLPAPQPPAGRNIRDVWFVATAPYPDAHFATFPPKLIEPMVLAGCPRDGTVLDPFAGSGTTLQVAMANGRAAVGIELNPDYAELMRRRLVGVTPSMFDA